MRVPKEIENYPQGDFWSTRWYSVNYKNDMFSAVVCGKRGIGKSYTLLSLGHCLDRARNGKARFNIDRVCFSGSEFLHQLSNENLPRGSVVCLDDAGISMYSRDALSKFVKLIAKSMQSIRYKNPIILMSLPSFRYLEKNTREMMHVYIEIIGRNENDENLAKLNILQLNPFQGEVYRHSLKNDVVTGNFNGLPITSKRVEPFRFPKPPEKLIEEYEEKKAKFLNDWNIKTYKQLKELEIKDSESKKALTLEQYKQIVIASPEEYMNNGKYSPSAIQSIEGISYTKATSLSAMLNIELKKNDPERDDYV